MVRATILTLFCFVSLCGYLKAEPARFLEVERWRIERIIQMGYAMDPETKAEIEQLAASFPESPVPVVLEAGYLYWMQNYKAWDEDLKSRFEERSAEALRRAKAYLQEHPDDADARFSVAMVELMQVIYYVDHHRWWAAFWKSRSSLKAMRQILAKYPDYHDAKLPLGMQNCYLSRTPGYLKPLAFLMRYQGDWELGLRYIKEAGEGGLFCEVDAIYHLSAIRLELEGDRQASRDEMAKLVRRFPGNLKFRAMLAELERGLGKQALALEGALAVLRDERVELFPGIRGRTLVTLLWSSLGANDLQRTMETVEALREFAAAHEGFEYDFQWVDFVEAEALWGLGRTDEAVELWRLVAKGNNAEAAATASSRLANQAKPSNSVELRRALR